MARDPNPSMILRQLPGWLWVSGIFRGFNDFLQEQYIDLIINCLHSGRGDILDMNSRHYLERVEAALPKVAYALALGQAVLVHCAQGIHRSGSFVVFFLALMLRLSYALSGRGGRANPRHQMQHNKWRITMADAPPSHQWGTKPDDQSAVFIR